MDDRLDGLTLGILGGTGPVGTGLASRWARAGLRVVIGSRDPARADDAAEEVNAGVGADVAPGVVSKPTVHAAASGAGVRDCVRDADVVVVAVPWDGHESTLRSAAELTAGKIVVDVVNPLGFDDQGPFALDVPEGSAAQQAFALLPDARVTAAFHHVSSVLLNNPDVEEISMDVLVLGEDREATDLVCALADLIPGMRGVYGGRLRNAGQVEALTANLIAVNRRYRTHAGIKVTGVR